MCVLHTTETVGSRRTFFFFFFFFKFFFFFFWSNFFSFPYLYVIYYTFRYTRFLKKDGTNKLWWYHRLYVCMYVCTFLRGYAHCVVLSCFMYIFLLLFMCVLHTTETVGSRRTFFFFFFFGQIFFFPIFILCNILYLPVYL